MKVRWPWVSRGRLALVLHNLREMRALHRADVEYYRNLLASEREAHTKTRDQMHQLRVNGADPVAAMMVQAQPDLFGPLTRAALNDMGIGLSAPLKKKMRERATYLWHEQRGQTNQDEVVAIAVRKGESVSL